MTISYVILFTIIIIIIEQQLQLKGFMSSCVEILKYPRRLSKDGNLNSVSSLRGTFIIINSVIPTDDFFMKIDDD